MVIEDGITSIGNYTFILENLKSIEWGENITRIGNFTLSGCKSMTELKLPKNLINIGKYSFAGWTSLTALEMPKEISEYSS